MRAPVFLAAMEDMKLHMTANQQQNEGLLIKAGQKTINY